jgi:hypothetical protein
MILVHFPFGMPGAEGIITPPYTVAQQRAHILLWRVWYISVAVGKSKSQYSFLAVQV